MNQTIFIIILKHGKAQINVASGSEGVYKYRYFSGCYHHCNALIYLLYDGNKLNSWNWRHVEHNIIMHCCVIVLSFAWRYPIMYDHFRFNVVKNHQTSHTDFGPNTSSYERENYTKTDAKLQKLAAFQVGRLSYINGHHKCPFLWQPTVMTHLPARWLEFLISRQI